MKLFISADIEGVSGVTCTEQTSSTGRAYGRAQEWMTGDVNAAIEGAFEAGVTDVLVKDAHGSALNVLPDELDERATMIQGWGIEDGMMGGITADCGLAFLVGYHPMVGTPDGILAHTWNSRLKHLSVNGTDIGETGISALQAGAVGVPIGLVSSCRAGCDQASTLLPWVEVVVVKRGLTQTAAEILPIKRAHQLIREGARRAVERIEELQPLRIEARVTVEVEWSAPHHAQLCAQLPGVELVGAAANRYQMADQALAMQQLRLMLRLG